MKLSELQRELGKVEARIAECTAFLDRAARDHDFAGHVITSHRTARHYIATAADDTRIELRRLVTLRERIQDRIAASLPVNLYAQRLSTAARTAIHELPGYGAINFDCTTDSQLMSRQIRKGAHPRAIKPRGNRRGCQLRTA